MKVFLPESKLAMFIILICIGPNLLFLFVISTIILCTEGVDYLKDMRYRKKHSERVTAVVLEIDNETKEDIETGYEIVSYEYNNQKYEEKVVVYEQGLDYYAGNGKEFDEETRNEIRERRDKQRKALFDSVGKEKTIYIDPKDPSDAADFSVDKGNKFSRTLVLAGALLMDVVCIFVVVFAIIAKRVGYNEKWRNDL